MRNPARVRKKSFDEQHQIARVFALGVITDPPARLRGLTSPSLDDAFASKEVMFWSFCAPKGGLGTSVVAAATALESARQRHTVLIDFGGDLAQIFGVDTNNAWGVHDWLSSSDDVGAESLEHLTIEAATNLSLLPAGAALSQPVDPQRAVRFVEAMHQSGDVTVADVGALTKVTDARAIIAASGDRTTCVVRGCYLALRRFSELPVVIDDVVEIQEPGRALRTLDIEAVVGMPISARIPLDPSIARAVDAGLLTQRMPRTLRRNVRCLLEEQRHLAVIK